ncbi:MAG: hypothetical protein ACREAK_01175 [Nitrosarchaeum sp.]
MVQRTVFIAIIVISVISYAVLVFLDRQYVNDLGLDLTIADILLAVVLSIIGITASRYFSDQTTNSTLQELKKLESKIEQKIKDLESKSGN